MVSKNTQDQSFETETKTAKDRSRDQDHGLEDYITGLYCKITKTVEVKAVFSDSVSDEQNYYVICRLYTPSSG